VGAYTGRVVEFDERRGRGTVESDSGERLPFHCVAIADGSRNIAVGARVEFTVGAGPVGLTEASAIRPAPAGRPT
jgi:CspA family cold shock protein